VDLRCVGEQVGGLLHQRRGDLAVEMGLTARVVGEDVEDPESPGAHLHGEPGDRAGLILDERLSGLQDLLHLGLLASLACSGTHSPTVTLLRASSSSCIGLVTLSYARGDESQGCLAHSRR
jgi:hypothetical protein